jgi:uncharacterized membrane protein
MHDKQQWIGTLISFGFLALVLALRARKMNKERPLKVERLWMLPAFYAVVVALLFWSHPPHGQVWLYAGLALAAGLGLGWYRGRLMHIMVDEVTHQVSQRGSMAAMIFIFLLVAVRYAARSLAIDIEGNDPESVVAATDVLLALGLGFIAAQRLEMGLRARALIDVVKGRTP